MQFINVLKLISIEIVLPITFCLNNEYYCRGTKNAKKCGKVDFSFNQFC